MTDEAAHTEKEPSDYLVGEVAKALDVSTYQPQFQGERAGEMREAKLYAIEVERAANIRAEQKAADDDAAYAAEQNNIRSASSAAQSLERQIASSMAAVSKITGDLVNQEQSASTALIQMDGIARLMSASATAGQVLGRLRDGYSRVYRHVIHEDARRKRHGRVQT